MPTRHFCSTPRTFLLGVILFSGCAEGPPSPVSHRPPDATVLAVLADGGAARDVRMKGLAEGLAPFLAEDALFVWPGTPAIRGGEAIAASLASTNLLDSARVFWQPLALHSDPTLTLAVGVLAMDDSSGTQHDSPRLGRYMAVWRPRDDAWRLEAMLISSISLPPLSHPTDGGAPASATGGGVVTLPEGLRAADSAFRAELAAEGPREALPRHMFETGMTFSSTGILNVGPTAVAAALTSIAPSTTWTMEPEAAGASGDGALGWVAGGLRISQQTDAGARFSHWNYMVFWIRAAGGEYRIAAAATNMRGP